MDKIKTVKIKNPDGSVSEETYTISVDAKNVDMKNGKDLQDTIGDINVDKDGSIAKQLGKYKDCSGDIEILYANVDNLEAADMDLENDIVDLQVNKINKTDIIDNLNSLSNTKVLSAKQGNELKKIIDKVTYIFPNYEDVVTGDYTIIQAYDKNILIDCTHSINWKSFKNTIEQNKITHFDIFILTHFHDDHVGNFINLVDNGYIDKNTIMYFPTFDTTLWSSNSAYPYYLSTMQKINDENLSYINPTEGQKIEINEYFNFKLYNTNDIFAYNNISTNYNETSMIAIFNHYDITSMFLGDCGRPAVQYFYNQGIFPNLIHLYKMGHHGIDTEVTSTYDIIKYLKIFNAIQIISIKDLELDKSAGSGTYDDMKKMGANIYVTGYNLDNIKFSSANNNIELIKGTNAIGNANTRYKSIDIYVDSENYSAERQDGSSTYPFKELNQAIGSISKDNGIIYTIHLANGTYNSVGGLNNNNSNIFGVSNTVKIIGESKSGVILKRGFQIYNCMNVVIDNLTIEMSFEQRGISCRNSNIYITNVDYVKSQDLVNTQNVFTFDNCIAFVKNCSMSEASHGIINTESFLTLDNISFTSIVTACIKCNGGHICHSNINITDQSPFIVNDTKKGYFENGVELLSTPFSYNTYADRTAQLNADISLFNKFKIEYKVDNQFKSEYIDNQNSAFYILLDMGHIGATGGYFTEGLVKLNGATAYLEKCKQMSISDTGNVTIFNPYNGLIITSIKGY